MKNISAGSKKQGVISIYLDNCSEFPLIRAKSAPIRAKSSVIQAKCQLIRANTR